MLRDVILFTRLRKYMQQQMMRLIHGDALMSAALSRGTTAFGQLLFGCISTRAEGLGMKL